MNKLFSIVSIPIDQPTIISNLMPKKWTNTQDEM